MTFSERIQLAFTKEQARRLAAGEGRLTKTELWRGVGATSGAATHWFNGSNGMDLDTCFKAAPILRVNPYWLFDESQPMAYTGEAAENEPHVIAWDNKDELPPDESRVWIDRWDYAFCAGNGGLQWEVRQKEALPFNGGLFKAIGSKPKDCKLLMVKGDSMEPFLFDRDMIMIDVSKDEIKDGKIYAIHFEGESLVKQLFKQAGGALTLHSYNTKYPDRLVAPDSMTSLAIAGEVVYRSGSGFV